MATDDPCQGARVGGRRAEKIARGSAGATTTLQIRAHRRRLSVLFAALPRPSSGCTGEASFGLSSAKSGGYPWRGRAHGEKRKNRGSALRGEEVLEQKCQRSSATAPRPATARRRASSRSRTSRRSSGGKKVSDLIAARNRRPRPPDAPVTAPALSIGRKTLSDWLMAALATSTEGSCEATTPESPIPALLHPDASLVAQDQDEARQQAGSTCRFGVDITSDKEAPHQLQPARGQQEDHSPHPRLQADGERRPRRSNRVPARVETRHGLGPGSMPTDPQEAGIPSTPAPRTMPCQLPTTTIGPDLADQQRLLTSAGGPPPFDAGVLAFRKREDQSLPPRSQKTGSVSIATTGSDETLRRCHLLPESPRTCTRPGSRQDPGS